MTGNTVTAGSDTDRQAVRDVLASLYQAWAAGDDDAVVGALSGSRATDHPSAIRFLTGDTAIVISEGGIIFPGQDAVASEGLIRATWALVRRDGGWRIASYHNSPAS